VIALRGVGSEIKWRTSKVFFTVYDIPKDLAEGKYFHFSST
jgi:hypothetical protein